MWVLNKLCPPDCSLSITAQRGFTLGEAFLFSVPKSPAGHTHGIGSGVPGGTVALKGLDVFASLGGEPAGGIDLII